MVPVGFSQVDSDMMAPSTTCHQSLSPSQPFRVEPSNMEIQPVWSLKSIGSGCRNPPPPRPRPGPGVPAGGGCCGQAATESKRIEKNNFGTLTESPFNNTWFSG